jgi:DinB superfamily
MYAKEAIQFALTASHRAVLSVIDKMSDAPTTFPTANGGCHPLWVLGHLAFVEGMIPTVLFGTPNPVAEWQKYFDENSEPVGNANAYPTFAEVRTKYLELCGTRTLRFWLPLPKRTSTSRPKHPRRDARTNSPRSVVASWYCLCTR